MYCIVSLCVHLYLSRFVHISSLTQNTQYIILAVYYSLVCFMVAFPSILLYLPHFFFLHPLPNSISSFFLKRTRARAHTHTRTHTHTHTHTHTLEYHARERNVLFNDALNTFYLRLYGVRHMVKDHSDSERGNPLPPHRLLFSINSKGSFICTIPQTG